MDRIFEDAKELTGGKVRARGLREGQGLWARHTLLLGDFLGLGIQWMRDEKQNL